MSGHMASSHRGGKRAGQRSRQSLDQGSPQTASPQQSLAQGSPGASLMLPVFPRHSVVAAETWCQSAGAWYPKQHSQTGCFVSQRGGKRASQGSYQFLAQGLQGASMHRFAPVQGPQGASSHQSLTRRSQSASPHQALPHGSPQPAGPPQFLGRGSPRAASPHRSLDRGSPKTASSHHSLDLGSVKIASPHQSLDWGSVKTASPHRSLDRGSPKTASSHHSLDLGSVKIVSPHQSLDWGSVKTASPPQSLDRGSPKIASPHQSLDRGSPKAASPHRSRDRGLPKAASPHQSLDRGSPKAVSPHQSLDRGSPKAASPHRSLDRGSQKTASPHRSLDRGTPKAASPHQSLAHWSEGACPRLPVHPQSSVLTAETSWRQSVLAWYPKLHSQTYFVPPLHFNKVSYEVKTVAGQPVLVPRVAPNQSKQADVRFPPSRASPGTPAQALASRVWPDKPVPHGPLRKVYNNEERDDGAMQQVREFIERLADTQVMLVLSQLDFRKYLDNHVDPITAAAARLLPRSDTLGPVPRRGDFDVLVISEPYGLVVIEVKSVGASSQTTNPSQAMIKVTNKAVRQLDKAETVLAHLTSDLAPPRITKSLALPYVESEQLEEILTTNKQLLQDLCRCLGVPGTDAAAVVSRCLCADVINSPTSSLWWQRTVTDHGPDANMTPELYERLAARFCGPATTIEVPTVTAPRRAVRLRTLREGVALAGTHMSLLTLYPQQVDLVGRVDPRVFLWGPPGTGKTVVLVLKAMQWGHRGKDVHLLSTHSDSRAATRLIEHQLLHTPGIGFTTATPPSGTTTLPSHTTIPTTTCGAVSKTTTAGPQLYTHFYDFRNNERSRDVKAAVEKLASVARDNELFVLSDETYTGNSEFADFCTDLATRVPSLHLWAAAVRCYDSNNMELCMAVERVTVPVRCPPAVQRLVAESKWIDDTTVPGYSGSPAPSSTDGPRVRQVVHCERSGDIRTPIPGHTGDRPEDCVRCAEAVVSLLLEELRLGQTDHHRHQLEYRDTLIICEVPRQDLPVVTCLRARDVPVEVVSRDADESSVRDVALAMRDTVTVTRCGVVSGLERRVVVIMRGFGDADNAHRLFAMSRCTSLLIWVGWPLETKRTK